MPIMNNITNDWQLGCNGIITRGAHILKTGEFSDCTFLVGSGQNQVKMSAHKVILAMASPVFRAMFYGGVAESGTVISIVDVEANVFKSLLIYIYTDEVNVDSFAKACELYYAAKKYMLPYLATECVTYLWSKLCAENALVAYEFAVFNDLEDLAEQCTKVIRNRAKEVLKSSSFTEASLETVCMMFSMDPLKIDSELDLFEAAERYLEANEECTVPTVDNLWLTAYEQYVIAKDTSPAEIKESSTALRTQFADAIAQSILSFEFVVLDIGSLKDFRPSLPRYLYSLPWNIEVRPENRSGSDGQRQKTLGIYIQCNANSKSSCWSCYAAFSLRVISHKPDIKPICLNDQVLFHSKNTIKGFSGIISWNNMLDPENGYIKDGNVTVEAYIAAERPHGVLGSSVKHTSSVAFGNDCSRFGAALANTLGELARTAANRAALTATNNEVNKKRKLSKSQKAKIQAKQRTALAVKKKAAALAAAAAAKMAS